VLRRPIVTLALAAAAVLATALPANASTARLQRILKGLDPPLYLTAPPGDHARLFIVEKGGKIVIDDRGRIRRHPFLDISRLVSHGSEQGLLSMAFDPHYASTGRFYVSYTNRNGNSRVVRYRVEPNHPNIANPNARLTLVAFNQPFANHNGGDIAFGPDGDLYMGFGDGGSEGDPQLNGQKRTGFLSKIMRIDINAPSPQHAVMYAYGLRNPWRFSFDSVTGDLWIGDVGQDNWEEIDHLTRGTSRGTNFGWSYYEGDHVFKRQPIDRSRLRFPVAEYRHTASPPNCAVTGGYVYHGKAVRRLDGYYIYADFCSGRMWRVRPHHRPVEMSTSRSVTQIESFGEGVGGGLYVITLSGSVYKVV